MTNSPQGVPAPGDGRHDPLRANPAPQIDGQPADQQPQPGSRYGTAAYDPGRSFDQAKPAKIATLRTATLVSLVLWTLSNILSVLLVLDPSYQDTLRQSFLDAGLSQEQAEQAVSMGGAIGLVFSLVIFVVTLVVYLLVLIGIPRGRNWARILGIVFAILGIAWVGFGAVGSLGTLGSVGALGIGSFVLSLLFLVANIWWLVLAFNRPVAQWFSARGQRAGA